MPEKATMLDLIRGEVSHRNLSLRDLARMTGMSRNTIGDALNGSSTTRESTVTLLYFKVILERDRNATESVQVPA